MLPIVSGEFGVVKEPEIRFTDNGRSWAKVRCSAKSQKRDANGGWVDGDPLYIDIVIGTGAEHLVESVLPGDSIIVTGKLKMREYESQGQKKVDYQIAADTIGVSVRLKPAKTPRMLEKGDSMTTDAVAESLGATEIPF